MGSGKRLALLGGGRDSVCSLQRLQSRRLRLSTRIVSFPLKKYSLSFITGSCGLP